VHSLIVGMTESGKTTLAKNLASNLVLKKQPVMVLDILGSAWGVNYQTNKIEDFMAKVSEVKNCYIFIDEAGEVGALNKEFMWLATRSRHYGHSVFFITQRSLQLKPIIRAQCQQLFLFCSAKRDCHMLYEDFNHLDLLNGSILRQGEFFHAKRFQDCNHLKVF